MKNTIGALLLLSVFIIPAYAAQLTTSMPAHANPGSPEPDISKYLDWNSYQEDLTDWKARTALVAKLSASAVDLAALQAKAEHGDADAQYALGEFYEEMPDPKDPNAPVNWFRKAAEGGSAAAQEELGTIYFFGGLYDVKKDDIEAAKWLGKAAYQGNTEAQQSLIQKYGLHYMPASLAPHDRDFTPNDPETFKWISMVADKGDHSAQEVLGFMYLNGDGIPKDTVEAAKWFRNCRYSSAKYYFYEGQDKEKGLNLPKDYAWAMNLFQDVIVQDRPGDNPPEVKMAQNEIGVMYNNGWGVPQSYTEAAKWYRQAAEQGNPEAQLNLATLYYQGKGVPQSKIEAYAWANVAASSGNKEISEKATATRNQIGLCCNWLLEAENKSLSYSEEIAKTVAKNTNK